MTESEGCSICAQPLSSEEDDSSSLLDRLERDWCLELCLERCPSLRCKGIDRASNRTGVAGIGIADWLESSQPCALFFVHVSSVSQESEGVSPLECHPLLLEVSVSHTGSILQLTRVPLLLASLCAQPSWLCFHDPRSLRLRMEDVDSDWREGCADAWLFSFCDAYAESLPCIDCSILRDSSTPCLTAVVNSLFSHTGSTPSLCGTAVLYDS